MARFSKWAIVAFLLALMAGLYGEVEAQAPAKRAKLVLGLAVPSFAYLPAYVGQEKGIWAKYGLEPEVLIFRGDADLQQAVAAGSVDVAQVSGPSAAGAIVKGLPVKIIALVHAEPTNMVLLVPKDSPIKGVDDLKGKTVAVTTHGSVSDWMVKRLSFTKGWGPEGIKRAPVGGFANLAAALKARQTDAIVGSLSMAIQFEGLGEARPLLNFSQVVPDYAYEVTQAPIRLISENPDILRRFLKGWYEGVKVMKESRDYTVDLMIRQYKLDRTVAEKTYETMIKKLSIDGSLSEKGLRVIAESLPDLGIAQQIPDVKDLYTTAFIPVRLD